MFSLNGEVEGFLFARTFFVWLEACSLKVVVLHCGDLRN